MTIIDPKTGLPIIGATSNDPRQQHVDYVNHLAREKAALQPDDHDWIVLISYSLTEHDAERAAIAKQTGIPATPSIPVVAEAMRADVGPLCHRCNQFFIDVHASPCPGMPFEQYIASLPEPQREAVLRRLAEAQQEGETIEILSDPPSGHPTIATIVE